MPVVYIDVLLAINWFVDYWLVYAVSCVLRITPNHGRMVLGALIGAVGAVVLFVCSWPTPILLVCHLLLSLILVKTSYSRQTWEKTFLYSVVLYVISGFFSGLLSALCTVFNNLRIYVYHGAVYMDVSPLLIAVLSVVSYGCIRIYEYLTRKRAPRVFEYRLFLDDGNDTFECRALYDTGMHLREPFSGKAVIIVEKDAVWPFLSPRTVDALTMEKVGSVGVRYVPYRSVGTEGLLPAFVPKGLIIQGLGGEKRDISGTYVAVSAALKRGEYRALIGADSVLEG